MEREWRSGFLSCIFLSSHLYRLSACLSVFPSIHLSSHILSEAREDGECGETVSRPLPLCASALPLFSSASPDFFPFLAFHFQLSSTLNSPQLACCFHSHALLTLFHFQLASTLNSQPASCFHSHAISTNFHFQLDASLASRISTLFHSQLVSTSNSLPLSASFYSLFAVCIRS